MLGRLEDAGRGCLLLGLPCSGSCDKEECKTGREECRMRCCCCSMLSCPAFLPAAKVKRMVVSTYQAASGAGQAAMEELELQTREVLDGERLVVLCLCI